MRRIMMTLAALVCLLPLSARADDGRTTGPAEQRATIQRMEAHTLDRLYRMQPDTQREIQHAAGYAVFSSGELAIIWVSGGYGHGIAHDNRSNQDTYMQMAKAGVGLGLGVKDFNTVFVFHDPKALRDFTTTGLDLSGSADASAKSGSKGAALSGSADILAGVRIYQLTDTGLIAQAMVQGTKYWRDDTLNNMNLGSAQ